MLIIQLSPGIRRASEHPLRHCAASTHSHRAYGVFIVSAFASLRTVQEAHIRPMKILRTFPPLDAKPIIGITLILVKDIPEDLYRELVVHPFAA